MGLFGRARPARTGDEPLTPAEGLAGVAFAAIYADGVFSAEESADLETYLAKMRIFRRMSPADVRAAFARVEDDVRRRGSEATLAASCAALPDDLKPTAFAMAADLLMGDDEFGEAERRFLAKLGENLGIEEADARTIADVIALKHRA